MNPEVVVVAILSLLGSGLVGYLAYKASERASQRGTVTQQIVTEKQTASSDLQLWTEQVVARLTKVEDDNEELRARVVTLEEDLHRSRNLLAIALDFIRHLIYRLLAHGERPDVPAVLREHLGH